MKKKIDFRQVETIMLDGSKKTLDISKELGNAIFADTRDIGELELAREIYKLGEVEIDETQTATLNRYVRQCFLAFVQEAVCPILDNLFTKNKS